MALFQNSVITNYVKRLDKLKVQKAYAKFKDNFHNVTVQENIRRSKEEQYQSQFLTDLFVNALDYIQNPKSGFNLITEQKNQNNSKKADGAIIINDSVIAVIELKGTNTPDLNQIESQAFGYKNNHSKCEYIITSNYEKLRFYIGNTNDYLEFNLFTLAEKEFEILYICLAFENISIGLPKKIKDESVSQENLITKKLYNDYSIFKRELYHNLVKLNNQYEPIELFKISQKLLDRFLFIFFAEDRQLLPTNLIFMINKEWQLLKNARTLVSLYDRYKMYFNDLDVGAKVILPAFSETRSLHNQEFEIYAYNGGLFKKDEILDNIKIDDELLFKHTEILSNYDFASEVDVNILGHIFENSLNELDELRAELDGGVIDKKTTKRKKDGVFYTPRYITKYIIDNTVGKLCNEKKDELQINEDDYYYDKKRQKKNTQALDDKLSVYRKWLLQITICDPACGSGAFLTQALDFLIKEHRNIDELHAKLFGADFMLSDIEKSILENNLFGVDINEESVEIAKLSLWLRTAQPNRKLNDLNSNIKCGNSLIDDIAVAGDKAFNWGNEFKVVFESGGFDIIIGNPPYGAKLSESDVNYYRDKYESVIGHSEVYYIFTEKAIKTLIKKNGIVGFIIPNAWLSNKYAKKLREILITETTICNLINFNRQIIFEDANVETSIFILKNTNPNSENNVLVGQDLNTHYYFKQKEWKKNENSLISFASDSKIDTLLKKINTAEFKLFEKIDISNGFKPYQAGYGINENGLPLTTIDVNNRIYHSNSIKNNSYKKEIKGKGVKRYSFKWEESYINWGKWLMSPKSEHYFEQSKILVRQVISDYLFAYLDHEKYYADQSLYVCTNYKGKNESLEFYTALLNSKLYGFYFRKFYSEEDDLFPKIKVNELKNLPIKNSTENFNKELSKLSILITKMINSFSELVQKFQRSIERKSNLENLPKKLDEWYLLSYTDFIKELAKKKIKLSLSDEAEWEEYFNTESKKALELKSKINATDKEIDQMVYKLYDLTEDEIKIVEGI